MRNKFIHITFILLLLLGLVDYYSGRWLNLYVEHFIAGITIPYVLFYILKFTIKRKFIKKSGILFSLGGATVGYLGFEFGYNLLQIKYIPYFENGISQIIQTLSGFIGIIILGLIILKIYDKELRL